MCFKVCVGYVTLSCIDIPEQPQNFSAFEIQSRFLSFSWDAPHGNNAPVLGYYVIYNQPSFAGGEMIVLDVPTEMAEVFELLPGVTYNFTVIAYNALGNSTESEVFSITTLEEGSTVILFTLCIMYDSAFVHAQVLLFHHKMCQLCHSHQLLLR